VPGSKDFRDEREKSASGMTWNDVKGHKNVARPHEVLIVRIENSEIVLRPIVGGIGDFSEAQRSKPVVDFPASDGHDVKAWLGGDGRHFVARLNDDAFEGIQAGNQEILKVKTFQIFEWRCFPQMEAAGVLGRGNQRQLNAGTETENAVAGDFKIAVVCLVMKKFMLLAPRTIFDGRSENFSRRPRPSAH
jgi:hypothetical protein